MNKKFLFWVPEVLRILFFIIGIGLIAYFINYYAALVCAVICLVAYHVWQMQVMYKMLNWTDEPPDSRLPNAWGAWSDLFAALYKLRRNDERSQHDLQEGLSRFRMAMESLPNGVVMMSDVLFLEWCNAAAQSHLGLSLDRDRGMRVTNLIRHPAFIDYLILGRYDKPLNITLHDRKLVMQMIPFEDRRHILVTQDVTKLERIDMMRRDFIANASHELRTPLTVINGFLEIAADDTNMDKKTRMAHIKLMMDQGKRMQNLLDDMLTLTRLESDENLLKPEQINMAQMLDSILKDAQALSAGHHVVTLDNHGPDVYGNPTEVRSALSNLVSNAIRYTPEQGEIRLSWAKEAEGACFSVTDSGIGIAPEHISRLTERFYRVDKGKSREIKGTGLGLAIVRHVLLRHGGQLTIESTLGKGSTFTAHFPHRVLIETFVPQTTVQIVNN